MRKRSTYPLVLAAIGLAGPLSVSWAGPASADVPPGWTELTENIGPIEGAYMFDGCERLNIGSDVQRSPELPLWRSFTVHFYVPNPDPRPDDPGWSWDPTQFDTEQEWLDAVDAYQTYSPFLEDFGSFPVGGRTAAGNGWDQVPFDIPAAALLNPDTVVGVSSNADFDVPLGGDEGEWGNAISQDVIPLERCGSPGGPSSPSSPSPTDPTPTDPTAVDPTPTAPTPVGPTPSAPTPTAPTPADKGDSDNDGGGGNKGDKGDGGNHADAAGGTDPGHVGALPETGADDLDALRWVAASSILAGIALIAVGKRRRPPVS